MEELLSNLEHLAQQIEGFRDEYARYEKDEYSKGKTGAYKLCAEWLREEIARAEKRNAK